MLKYILTFNKRVRVNYSNKLRITDIIVYILLIIIAVIMLMPFVWMINTSLKPHGEVYEFPPRFLPGSFNFRNYVTAWIGADFSRYFLNTVIYTFGRTFFDILLGSMAGYAFAFFRFSGRKTIFIIILVTMMIPFQAKLIPLFLLIRYFPLAGGNNILGSGGTGLMNTWTGLIAPGVITGFSIFLFRQFFRTLPRSLMEVARIDGCSEFRIYWQIMFPLAKPAIVSLSILSFTQNWNALLWPLVATNNPGMRTLQVGLAIFQGEQLTAVQYNELMAGAVIAIIPTVLIFLIGQKHFTRGISLTGLKYCESWEWIK